MIGVEHALEQPGTKEQYPMTLKIEEPTLSPAAIANGERFTAPSHITNPTVRRWVSKCIALCDPDDVYWCDGSENQKRELLDRGVREGVLTQLNQQKLPGCYLHRSNPNDVARTEQLTFICTPSEDMVGPTNNWMEVKAAYAKLRPLFDGCMRGRTMYVVPFVMGPIGSPLAKVGVQITDSLYVAVSMGIMTRMGEVAWRQLGDSDEWTRCLHSSATSIPNADISAISRSTIPSGASAAVTAAMPCWAKNRLALRIASFLGWQQGWMAEHMLLLGATAPKGEKTYVAAAFPSAAARPISP